MTSIYSFKVKDISGGELDFGAFKGKKIMVVNVASACGLTPQYAQLQELHSTFQDKLVVVGIPANNFGGQEPGSNSTIKAFCNINYGVTFPMAAKISVTGDDQHELYKWLTTAALNGVQDSEVTWNFQKYLLDENGQLQAIFPPNIEPADESILTAIGVA